MKVVRTRFVFGFPLGFDVLLSVSESSTVIKQFVNRYNDFSNKPGVLLCWGLHSFLCGIGKNIGTSLDNSLK